jgi:hypothetical protein
MYDIKSRKQFNNVGDLKRLLAELPNETKVTICGEDCCWLHVEEDKSVICFDCEDLDDCYETKEI